jgi:hypothetical protein
MSRRNFVETGQCPVSTLSDKNSPQTLYPINPEKFKAIFLHFLSGQNNHIDPLPFSHFRKSLFQIFN